jgi:hypothetical protein
MRSALKERQKTPDVAAYRHPRELCGLYCSASHGFLRSFRATRFFTVPRVPPSLHPGLSSCTPSAFSTFPCFCRFQPVPKAFGASVRYLMYFSPITLRPCSACSFCDYFFRTGSAIFTVKMLPVVRHPRQSPARWSYLADRTTTENKPRPDRRA